MATFHDERMLSSDGRTQLRVRYCLPEGTPRGVVQIAHGIAEHVERYDGFSAFLASHGYVVTANDHLGHGKSVQDPKDLGFFAEKGGWELVVDDMRRLYTRTSGDYPGLPYFLFGHSMGSFLARTYLIRCGHGLRGVILSGTGQQPPAAVTAGLLLGKREIARRGGHYRSEKLNNMAFGSYTRGIVPLRTVSDWLSRDPAEVDRFVADPLCGFVPTAELFYAMMHGIAFNQNKKNLARMEKSLPVHFMSGAADPVGAYGKGVIRAYRSFLDAGMLDVSLKLYAGGRHEMLNEINRDEVCQDVLSWLESKC
ncbi:MAG: lysophospholipase [Oscillospiraceae bacterium]|nr:lysophospholipase [Oscillospiraceae bacterium]